MGAKTLGQHDSARARLAEKPDISVTYSGDEGKLPVFLGYPVAPVERASLLA
jgi:hypothetical protein